MDWGLIIIELCISLMITVFAYLLVPVIIVISGKRYELKKIKRINTINCAVVWLLFRIIQIALENEPGSGAAVFLWGSVSYWLLKKYCLKEESTYMASPAVPEAEQQIHVCISNADESICTNGELLSDMKLEQDMAEPKITPMQQTSQTSKQAVNSSSSISKLPVKFCSRCGHIIDADTKKCTGCGKQYFKGFSWKTFLIILEFLFIISFAGNLFLIIGNINLQDEIANLEIESSVLNKENEKLNETLSFLQKDRKKYYDYFIENSAKVNVFDRYIVLIDNNGTNIYHKYECHKFVGKDFFAHNIEYAKYVGYSPCPLCCE